MRFTAQVIGDDGALVRKARVELVDASGKVWFGDVQDGALTVEAEPGPVWGVRIDGKPVIAIPVAASANDADLGEIVLVASGVDWPSFHAPDDRVYGVPRAALRTTSGSRASVRSETKTAKLTLGDLLGSAAQQLTPTLPSKSGLSLTSASLVIKGIPTTTGDSLGLEFPTQEVAATGAGLSEVAFSLKPERETKPVVPTASGPEVPNTVGYTRELAARKLASVGLLAEFTNQVVDDVRNVGRVVRTVPAAGTRTAPRAVVRLFIGQHGGGS